MIKEILTLGNRIEIVEKVKSPGAAGEERRIYTSQLLEFDDDDEDVIKIAMPIYEGRLIPPHIGKRYNLCFYTKNGLYAVDGVVEQRYSQNNIYMIDIRLTTALRKHQRRQYYRLGCNFGIYYKEIEDEEFASHELTSFLPESVRKRMYKQGISVDISGGGVRFICDEEYSYGDILQLYLDFDTDIGTKTIETMASVVAATTVKNKSNAYEIRMNFIGIPERDREFIIKFIFYEQRKKRQKESGL